MVKTTEKPKPQDILAFKFLDAVHRLSFLMNSVHNSVSLRFLMSHGYSLQEWQGLKALLEPPLLAPKLFHVISLARIRMASEEEPLIPEGNDLIT